MTHPVPMPDPILLRLLGPTTVYPRACEAVSGYFQVPLERILGSSRAQEVMWPRQVLQWILVRRGYSHAAVARMTGHHHSAILHNCRVVQQYRDSYPQVIELTERLLEAATDQPPPPA